MSPAIQFLRPNTLSIQRQELHSPRNLLGPRPGPQSLFRFGPSKGPHRQRTLNRRRNKNQLQSRKHVSPPQNERFGRPGPLPIISEVPPADFNSDESDYDGGASTHDHPDTDVNYRLPAPSLTTSTPPPGTSTLTLTLNPHAPPPPTIRILQPNPGDPPRDPPFRPWTNNA